MAETPEQRRIRLKALADQLIAESQAATPGGVAKAIGTGAVRGISEIPMAPVSLARMAETVLAPAFDLFYYSQGKQPPRGEGFMAPTYRIQDRIRAAREGLLYQPKPGLESAAANITEMALPAALPLRRIGLPARPITQGVIPGVTSEVAGQATEGTEVEGAARIMAGVAGGLFGAALSRPSTAEAMLRERLPRGQNRAEQAELLAAVNEAEALMNAAKRRGLNLTFGNALLTTSKGRIDLTDIENFIELDRKAGNIMRRFYAGQPEASREAVDRELNRWSTGQYNQAPEVGVRLQQLADQRISRTRQAINRMAAPYYKAAEDVPLPAADFARLSTDELFQRALREVRADPAHARHITHLPDNSVGVMNEVKQWLDGHSKELGTARGPKAAAPYAEVARDARQAATDASPDLSRALEIEAEGRRRVLTPMEEGMTGQVASTPDLGRIADTLLPTNPKIGDAAQAGSLVRSIARQDPEAATFLVRDYISRQLNQAMKISSARPGLPQRGGFNFARLMNLDSPRGEVIRAAVLALPDGPARWNGMRELTRILEAQGGRRQLGSPTQPRQAMAEEAAGAGVTETVVRGALGEPLSPLKGMAEQWQRWRLGNNLEEAAAILTDPASGELFRRLLAAKTMPEKYRIVGMLLYRASEQAQGQMGSPQLTPDTPGAQ